MAVNDRSPAGTVVLVPDQAVWAAAGIDLGPVDGAGELSLARRLVLADRLPKGLREALAEQLIRLPDGDSSVSVLERSPLAGSPTAELLEAIAATDELGGEDGDQDEQGDHDDHEDMMAVTGDPSDDGLVMEDADATIGPIDPALPTGLLAELRLDGDVVCRAQLRSVLPGPPERDPLAPRAHRWTEAGPKAREEEVPGLLAAAEVERAVGHSLWLARFVELLGWVDQGTRLRRGVRPLIGLNALPPQQIVGRPMPALDELRGALASVIDSRRLGWRTAGLAPLRGELLERTAGPNARASGIAADARNSHPAYQELGFSRILREEGDAQARASLRAEEALAALELAAAAGERERLPGGGEAIEAPRGPLVVGAAPALPDWAVAAREAAERLAVGEELARSLVAIASFDLTPWTVGG